MKLDSEGTGAAIGVGRQTRIPGLSLDASATFGGTSGWKGNDYLNFTDTLGHWYVAFCVY